MLRLSLRPVACATALAAAGLLAACDAGFDGDPNENRLPETELSVRSSDLREDLGTRRLVSTVSLAWSGTDPDGFVPAFDVRAYVVGAGAPEPGAEDGWRRTARRDSTILLPIPEGQSTADVAVEVRAVDNAGAIDPTPARTVFPILNSPPTFRLSGSEVPPDSTWPVVSFAFSAADRDGVANLAGIEIALNDTTAGFTRLPADVTFVSLVASEPGAAVTEARLFVGRGFSNSGVSLPGLRLDADNVVYFRSVDQAAARSRIARFPALDADGEPERTFYVRRVTSPVLLVDDYRTSAGRGVVDVARRALALNGTGGYDTWDLSRTPQSAAAPTFSANLPATPDPTLRRTLALWTHVYWVSNAVTNSTAGNNLPRAASVLDLFFNNGGRMLVHTPISLPQSAQGGDANAAIDVLPLTSLITYPAGVFTLRSASGTTVEPAGQVPGTGRALPPLVASQTVTSVLPYVAGPDDVPLYRMPFYHNNTPSQPWQGSQVVASIRSDRRVALFALPLFSGSNDLFVPAPGQTEGATEALALLLDGLDFPAGARRPAL